MRNIETQGNTVIGYIGGRRVIQLSLKNGQIITDTSTALPTDAAGEYIALYSDCLALVKQRQREAEQHAARHVGESAVSPAAHDDLLFARYQGFHDYLTEGEGSKRTHPTNQDWNEAYDEGRNEAEGLSGPEGDKPFSFPEIGAFFDEGEYLDLCKMIEKSAALFLAHPSLSDGAKIGIAELVATQFGIDEEDVANLLGLIHEQAIEMPDEQPATKSKRRTLSTPSAAARNADFLAAITDTERQDILDAIAKLYGITAEDAYAKVTRGNAEDLLECMPEPQRTATRALMLRHSPSGSSELNQAFNILLAGTKYGNSSQ